VRKANRRAQHGKPILVTVSREWTREYGKGFDISSLGYMRQFYEAYAGDKKVSPLVTQLPWTHNLIILGQSERELEQQFRQALFERTVLHSPKVAPSARQISGEAAADIFRDAYVAFLNRDALRHELSWTHYRLLLRVDDVANLPFNAEGGQP
jgi:hypothetical protein